MEPDARHPSLGTALQVLALGALLVQSWRLCRGTLERRRSGRPQAKPAPLQTWEGEGGQHEPPAGSTATAAGATGNAVSAAKA